MQCSNCGSKQFINGQNSDMVVCRECGEPGDISKGRPYASQPGSIESEMSIRNMPGVGGSVGPYDDSGGNPLATGLLATSAMDTNCPHCGSDSVDPFMDGSGAYCHNCMSNIWDSDPNMNNNEMDRMNAWGDDSMHNRQTPDGDEWQNGSRRDESYSSIYASIISGGYNPGDLVEVLDRPDTGIWANTQGKVTRVLGPSVYVNMEGQEYPFSGYQLRPTQQKLFDMTASWNDQLKKSAYGDDDNAFETMGQGIGCPNCGSPDLAAMMDHGYQCQDCGHVLGEDEFAPYYSENENSEMRDTGRDIARLPETQHPLGPAYGAQFDIVQTILPGPSTVEVEQEGEMNPIILQHDNPEVLDQAKDTLKSSGLLGDIGGILGGAAGIGMDAIPGLDAISIPAELAGGLLGASAGKDIGNDVGGALGDIGGALGMGGGIPEGQANNLNTLSHVDQQGFSLNDELGQAFLKAFPAMSEFAHSPESGENHPDIANFSMMFDQAYPGLKDQPIRPEHQAEIDSLKKPEAPKVSAYEIIHMGAGYNYNDAGDPGKLYEIALRQGLPYPADPYDTHSQPNAPIQFGDMGPTRACQECGGEGCPACDYKGEIPQSSGPDTIQGEGATTPYNINQMEGYGYNDLGGKIPMRQGATYPPSWGDAPAFARHADGWTSFEDEYSSPNSVPNRVNTEDPDADGIDSAVHQDNPDAWQRMDNMQGGGSDSPYTWDHPLIHSLMDLIKEHAPALLRNAAINELDPNYAEPHQMDTQFDTVSPKSEPTQTTMTCPRCQNKLIDGSYCPSCQRSMFQMMTPQAPNPQQMQQQNQMQQQQIMQNSHPYLPAQLSFLTGRPSGAVVYREAGIGPHNEQQFQMVMQYLKDNGQWTPQTAEQMIMNPDMFAEPLAAIQQKGTVPDVDPNAAPPPMAPPPVPGGGSPPPSGPPTTQMQASRIATDTIAQACPKCQSHSTSLMDEDGNCNCSSCGNIWKMPPDLTKTIHEAADIGYNPWVTQDGSPLRPGMSVNMFSSASPIPDEVQITDVKPNSIVYTLQGAYGLNHETEITQEEARADGLYFQAEQSPTVQQQMPQPPMEQPAPEYNMNSDNTGFQGSPETDNLAVQSSCSNCGGSVRVASKHLCDNCLFDLELGDGLVKQAGKDYSAAEKAELINEPGTARNAFGPNSKLNLESTHYLMQDNPDTDLFW